MNRIYSLPIDSIIRIYNYIENDKGYGEQIEYNNSESIYDMQDNFNWSDEKLKLFLNNVKYDGSSDFIHCSFNDLYSLNTEDIPDYLNMVLDDTPSGDVLQIIQEEYDMNGMGDVIL